MTTKVVNTTTSYQSIGTGDALILLHGWGCDWQIWSPIIRDLSSQYQLIIPDLPAFGQSSIADNKVWTSSDYVQWLDEFLKKTLKKNQNYILVGHSFGGKIAALYSAKHKDTSQKALILVDAAGLPVELNSNKKVLSNILKIIPPFIKNTLNDKTKKQLFDKLGISTDHLNSNSLQKQILEKTVHENIESTLSKINPPTLLVWGKHDPDTPLEKGKIFKEKISNSKLLVFENSEHFPFISETTKFIQEINTYAAEVFS